MTRYDSPANRRQIKKQEDPHPVWRGIGCVMMILIPLISYALAVVFIDLALKANWPLPYQLLGTPQFPAWVWTTPQLVYIVRPLASVNNLYANLFLTVVFMIILGGLFSVLNAVLYRLIGPPRYGPQDVPPPKNRPKPYKR
jgi:hypothetical protein